MTDDALVENLLTTRTISPYGGYIPPARRSAVAQAFRGRDQRRERTAAGQSLEEVVVQSEFPSADEGS